MKWKDRRLTHSMQDPVRGEFRKTGEYFPHPGRTPMQVMLTGVVTGPGIPPTSAEHLRNDFSDREFVSDTLPALIDRVDPTRFVILWDEISKPDPRQDALQEAAHVAEQMNRDGEQNPRRLPASGPEYGMSKGTGALLPEPAPQRQRRLPASGVTGQLRNSRKRRSLTPFRDQASCWWGYQQRASTSPISPGSRGLTAA